MGRLNLGAARETIVGNALRAHGIVDDELVRLIAQDYDIARTKAIHPISGAIETISDMRQSGVKLALLTNGEAKSQREKIKRFQLERLFDAIFIEGECGYGKPEERVYLDALSRLGVSPEETWMAGDNWEWEVVAPQRIGIKGIWVNANGRPVPEDGVIRPFLVVNSLVDLTGHFGTSDGDKG
jgi:putative hydrolase of the HAD superfamily